MNKIDKGFLIAALISLALSLFFPGNSIISAIGIGLVLVTVGAFIAYWGDIIGHTIGKKRLSTFNLRPRQTAILWTIAAGGASALLAYMILLGINEGFRTAVFNGIRLVHENHELSKRDALLKDAILKSKHAVKVAQSATADADARAESAQAQEQQSVAELGRTQTDLRAASRSLTTALGDLKARQTELDRTEAQLGDERTNLNLTRVERDRLRRDNATARSQVMSEEAKVTAEQTKLRGVLKDIDDAQRIYNPQMKMEQVNRLIYDNEQEVGRAVIQNDTSDKIVVQLNRFLDRLSAEAEAQGAAKNTTTGRAVKVATVEILSTVATEPHGPRKGPEFAEEKENLAVLADQIHNFGEPSVVVIASSIGNSFDKGTVIVQLHPYVNHLAVPKNTVVATTLVPAADSDPERIMASIQTLLVRQVRPYAIRKGVIPVQENSRDQAQLGDVPLAEIVRTVEQVQAMKSDSIISAFVPSDVYSADQLHLHLSVRSAALTTSLGSGVK